jgi:hypothetical protein
MYTHEGEEEEEPGEPERFMGKIAEGGRASGVRRLVQ